ncbi:MAG: sulfatase [Thermoanaerobaculia bacterium]
MLALAGGVGLLLLVSSHAAEEMNVILITVDTLRADHLGVYGYTRQTSPNVDRFASVSTLFRYAFSHAASTNPSFGSLMTSYYPHETKVLSVKHLLPPGAPTLAAILKANGYQTAAIVSHFSLRRGSGFEQGFDVYDDQMDDLIEGPTTGSTAVVRKERVAPKTTLAAVKWLEGHHKKKFFLWVHYDDPHGPYVPPPPYNTMFIDRPTLGKRALPVRAAGKGGIPSYQILGDHREPEYYIAQYDGEIRFFDQAFGDLIKKIQELRLLDNSLVLFTSDHGESMGEHDYYVSHGGGNLYNDQIHVPLVVRFPRQAPGAKEIRYPVAHVDVLPTILETASVRVPSGVRGRSLLSDAKDRAVLVEQFRHGKYAVITNGMKLIQATTGSELYDLQKDFAEHVDLMNGQRAVGAVPQAAALKNTLDALRQLDALRLGPPTMWTKGSAIHKEFRALGYVQ